MASAVVRGLAAVVVVAALAGVAGCKDKTPAGDATRRPATEATGAESKTASLFPGRDSDEGGGKAMHLPTGSVGESVGRKVAFVNTTDKPMTITSITATSDTGRTVIAQDGCTRVKVQPGDSCEVALRHTASDSGPFTGHLIAMTDQGFSFAATFSGTVSGSVTPGPDTSVSTTAPGPTTTPPSSPVSTDTSTDTSTTGTTDEPTPQPDATDTPTDMPTTDIT